MSEVREDGYVVTRSSKLDCKNDSTTHENL